MVEIRNRFYVVRKLQIVFDARCGNRLSKKMINATVNDFILVIVGRPQFETSQGGFRLYLFGCANLL